MNKAIVSLFIVGAMFGAVSVAHGASLTQAQVDSILSMLRSFGAEESVIANVRTSLTGSGPTTPPVEWCHTFNTNLKIGDKGAEVEGLRLALLKDQGSQTENFDDVFNEFVASWVTSFQEKYKDEVLTPVGLAHGTGYVGPATRKKLNALYGCGGGGNTGGVVEVSVPASFSLTVGETAQITSKRDTTIKLNDIVGNCPLGAYCAKFMALSALITVTNSGGCGRDASPLCLGPPGFTRDYTIKVGGSIPISELTLYLVSIDGTRASFKVDYASSNSNKPPVIKGVSGPVKLKVNETGTWTVSASDPEGASLRYSIVWGDERLGVAGTGTILKENRTGSINNQEVSFTHSFSSVGIYKILFSVTDNAGNEARSTITVNVGEATEKNGYLYLVPDKVDLKVGETQEIKAYYQPPMPQCASGYACIQMMPVSYRVPAKFSSDNLDVVDIAIAIPMCIPANPASGNYCGEMAIAQGKKAGSATITATYNGLSVSAKATVR